MHGEASQCEAKCKTNTRPYRWIRCGVMDFLICELDAPKESERPRDHSQVAQDRIPVQPARAIPADRQARIAARQDDAESLELLTSVLRCGWAGDGGIGLGGSGWAFFCLESWFDSNWDHLVFLGPHPDVPPANNIDQGHSTPEGDAIR